MSLYHVLLSVNTTCFSLRWKFIKNYEQVLSHTRYSFHHGRVIFKHMSKIVVNAMQWYYSWSGLLKYQSSNWLHT